MDRIMLIDDEPIFLSDMRDTLLTIRGGADGVFEFYDAAAALKAIPDCRPEIVFVDIIMPSMDGLEFISRAKPILPDAVFVIVTGYRSFEYAQRALQVGADDYILKPVEEGELRKVLDKCGERVRQNGERNRQKVMDALINGAEADPRLCEAYFKYPHYVMLDVISHERAVRDLLVQRARDAAVKPGDYMWQFDRPDRGETLIVLGLHSGDEPGFVAMQDAVDELAVAEKPANVIIGGTVTDPARLRQEIEALKRDWDAIVVFGRNGVYRLNDCAARRDEALCRQIKQGFEREIGYFKNRLNVRGLEKAVQNALLKCREARFSFRTMHLFLQESVFILNRAMPFDEEIERQQIYHDIDEMATRARDYPELEDMYLSYLCDLLHLRGDECITDNDTFRAIKEYIDENIHKRITVTEICNTFAISQSKLGKLFRKHYDESFIKYLTRCKMEYARELILREKELTVNDIASSLGYSDPLYFSKVFKYATGLSPTQYREKNPVNDMAGGSIKPGEEAEDRD